MCIRDSLTIGGGVPRNWAQQFGVYAELLARRGYEKIPLKRYNYGVRICPEPCLLYTSRCV